MGDGTSVWADPPRQQGAPIAVSARQARADCRYRLEPFHPGAIAEATSGDGAERAGPCDRLPVLDLAAAITGEIACLGAGYNIGGHDRHRRRLGRMVMGPEEEPPRPGAVLLRATACD